MATEVAATLAKQLATTDDEMLQKLTPAEHEAAMRALREEFNALKEQQWLQQSQYISQRIADINAERDDIFLERLQSQQAAVKKQLNDLDIWRGRTLESLQRVYDGDMYAVKSYEPEALQLMSEKFRRQIQRERSEIYTRYFRSRLDRYLTTGTKGQGKRRPNTPPHKGAKRGLLPQSDKSAAATAATLQALQQLGPPILPPKATWHGLCVIYQLTQEQIQEDLRTLRIA